MILQNKEWRVKAIGQLERPVGPPQPTGQTGSKNRSDRQEQPVRQVDPEVEQQTESAMPVLVTHEGTSAAPPI